MALSQLQSGTARRWLADFESHGVRNFSSPRISSTVEIFQTIDQVVRATTGFCPFSVQALTRQDPFHYGYIRAAFFICRIAESFRASAHLDNALLRSAIGLLWIKTVDNYIDCEGGHGRDVLRRLTDRWRRRSIPAPINAREALTDTVAGFVQSTERFEHDAIELAGMLAREKTIPTIAGLINFRLLSGEYTSRLLLHIMGESIQSPSRFEKCLLRVGAVGNLCDQVVDLSRDYKDGNLGFRPTLMGRVRLFRAAVREVRALLREYPELRRESRGIMLRLIKWRLYNRKIRTDAVLLRGLERKG